jgi:hypothetical protein
MKKFDSETSELKLSKDFFIFTQRTSMKFNYYSTKENFPFDRHSLRIKFELTSKTVIMEQHKYKAEKESTEVTTSTAPDKAHPPRNRAELTRSIVKSLRLVLPETNPEKGKAQGQNCIFRFNMHDNPEFGVVVGFKHGRRPDKDVINETPDLNIAYNLVSWKIPAEVKAKDEIYFPVVIAKVPLVRVPERVLATYCLPLLVLNIMALCGFTMDSTDFYSHLILAAFISVSVIILINFFDKVNSLPNAKLTMVDYAFVQTILVAILLVVDCVAVHLGGKDYYAHIIIPLVAGALVLSMNWYLVTQYSLYLTEKATLLNRSKFGPIKKSTVAFEDSNWRVKGSKLPDNCSKIPPPNPTVPNPTTTPQQLLLRKLF